MSTIANTTATEPMEAIAPEIRRRQKALLAPASRLRTRRSSAWPGFSLTCRQPTIHFWVEVLEAT